LPWFQTLTVTLPVDPSIRPGSDRLDSSKEQLPPCCTSDRWPRWRAAGKGRVSTLSARPCALQSCRRRQQLRNNRALPSGSRHPRRGRQSLHPRLAALRSLQTARQRSGRKTATLPPLPASSRGLFHLPRCGVKVLLPERMGCSKPTLRQEFQMAEMSPLRRRMIEDMTIRNLSPATQQSYLYAVSKFSRHFGHSPDRLGVEDVRAYLVHLTWRGFAWSSLNQTVCALRFFYGVTLAQSTIVDRIPFAREPRKLPSVLGAEEVVRFLEAVSSLKARVALTTAYA